MNTLVMAILSIGLSVTVQFSLKAGMYSEGVKEILAQPSTLRTIFTEFMEKFVLFGLFLYGLSAAVWPGVLSK